MVGRLKRPANGFTDICQAVEKREIARDQTVR